MRGILLFSFSAVCLSTLRASAQAPRSATQASLQPTFDVVSIRPMREDDTTPTHITNSPRNGYFKAINVNLKALMEVAYGIPDLRMYGGPEWTTKAKFSLEAKTDPSVEAHIAELPVEQGKEIKRQMLTALLVERFKLRVHNETREMPIYALVAAKGGPKLDAASSSNASSLTGRNRITINPGNDSLAILAYELSWRLDRPVLDRTGVQYRQKLRLVWSGDDEALEDSSGPSLFSAVEEQLSLKLEPGKGPVAVLLIDHAEAPAEN